jgi:hypothetical protein
MFRPVPQDRGERADHPPDGGDVAAGPIRDAQPHDHQVQARHDHDELSEVTAREVGVGARPGMPQRPGSGCGASVWFSQKPLP